MDWEGDWDDPDHPAFFPMQAPPRFDARTPDYVQEAYDVWLAACGDRDLPPTSSLTAFFFPPKTLPYVGIFHVEHDVRRLRIRLSGTAVGRRTGVEFTGFYTDQVPGAEDANIRFHWCAKTGRPYSVVGKVTWPAPRYAEYGVLALPFGDSRGTVSKVALIFSFF